MAERWRELLRTDPLNFPSKVLRYPRWPDAGLEDYPEGALWGKAEEIIRSVFRNKRTAVQSGHSLSKDWSAGLLVVQWLITNFPSKVICTAPTGRQVKDVMFREIAKQWTRFARFSPWELPREALSSLKLELGPEWFALGFTTRESGEQIGKFQGFKSPNMLVVVSEAQDVDDSVFDQIDGILTSENAHILEIGNPVLARGKFWEHCTQARHNYHVIKISCHESPNVVAGKEVIPGMVTGEWIEERRRVWGEEHPYWFSRVLGEFPQSATDAIIPLEWILAARNREVLKTDDLKVGGLDVALRGTDETVHLVLDCTKVSRIDTFHDMSGPKIVGWSKNLIREEKLSAYAVDQGGLSDIAMFLIEDGFPAVEFQFGGGSESEDYANLGAQAWWHLREAFQRGEISIPDDEILIGQLAARRYDFTQQGKRRIKLESKKDARTTRGEVSPDRADALAMAWWTRLRMLRGFKFEPGSESDSAKLEREVARSRGQSLILEANEIRY